MNTVRKTLEYLIHLEWTERRQHTCLFCDVSNFKNIVYEDEDIIAIDNLHRAGQAHWLIMPKAGSNKHIRDTEGLTKEDLPLLKSMDKVKELLLKKHYPTTPCSTIHSGYHRGRRKFVGSIFWPDIVSIHHLHLHVIVDARWSVKLFKYPTWLPLMWVSDESVLGRIQGRA